MAHDIKLSDFTVGQIVVVGNSSPYHAGIHPCSCNSLEFPENPCRVTVLSVGSKWLTVRMNGRKVTVAAPADRNVTNRHTVYPVEVAKDLYRVAMDHYSNGSEQSNANAERCVESL